MAPRKKVEPKVVERRVFPPAKINRDCPYGDPQCFLDFECVGCAYNILVAREASFGVGLWHDYTHEGKAIKLSDNFVPPVAKSKVSTPAAQVVTVDTFPKTTADGTTIRRLASGTLVEVNKKGKIIRTLTTQTKEDHNG